MTCNIEYLNFKSNRLIPFDQFVETVLYKPKIGYYTKKIPFGRTGDFITAPTISNLFSEIISIWIVSSWEELGKPRCFNFVELGPGDGSFAKVFVNTLKKFPNLFNSINIYLYEKSEFLKNIQKEKLKDSKIKWINNFDKINKGPVIFFGNEFFDAIPIKQFTYKKKLLLEKYCYLDHVKGFKEVYQRAKIIDHLINSKNDLQLVVEKKHPIIRELLIDIRKIKGCYFSRMTGSGSTCYGLFTNENSSKVALKKIKKKYPKFSFLTVKTI